MERFGYVGLLTILLGLLILATPFVATGSTLKWLEFIFGAIVLIVGLYDFSIRHKVVIGAPAKVAK
jgi:uncharacterized membrane protein HdeD (DUF308 family)